MKQFDVTITSPQGIIRLPNIEYIETDKDTIYLSIDHNEYIVYNVSDADYAKVNEVLIDEESRRIVFNFSEKPTVNSSRRRLKDR